MPHLMQSCLWTDLTRTLSSALQAIQEDLNIRTDIILDIIQISDIKQKENVGMEPSSCMFHGKESVLDRSVDIKFPQGKKMESLIKVNIKRFGRTGWSQRT